MPACLLPALLFFPLSAVAIDPESGNGETYVDQLIDTDVIDEDVDPVYLELSAQPPGRRYLGTRLYHFRESREGQGVTGETGLQVDWRRETYDYGELELDAALMKVNADAGRTERPATGSLLTLRQHDFALNNDWLMQNSLGVDRSWVDSMLAGSYRIKLPSSLLSGVNTHLSSSSGDFRMSAGRLGRLDTGQAQTFDTTSGILAGAGYSARLTDELQGGMHIVNINGSRTVPDHQSYAGVVEYRDGPYGGHYQAHVLADSLGATGLWLDGDVLAGRWRNRFGAYRLEPDLLWTDVAVASDQQGFYTRADLQSLRYQLAGGIEFNTTDLGDDPQIVGTRNTTAFVNGNRQLTRRSSIGGTVNLRDTRNMDPVPASDARDIRLTVYGSHRLEVGTTRLQVQVADIERGVHHGHGSAVTWDQAWEIDRRLLLSSTLGYEEENGTGSDGSRTTAGLLAWHDYSNSMRWDANVNWTHSRDDISGRTTDTVNAGMSLLWRFQPGWEATLRASINDAREDASGALTGTEFDGVERTLFLSVRREMHSGRPFERVGRDTGKSGYGTVEGVIFYDENRDGIRQAGEAVAAGVYVYLDRRYQQRSDRDGRFEFAPVPIGQHTLTIAQEDLPLPWGLEDEAPRVLDVQVRRRTGIMVPLVRFDG
jgi:hypothetical protein